jgi:LytS/YehU family sensor histidine kinase
MLHESNEKTIPLNLEIKCIHNYIALEKLRYADTLAVSVNMQDEVRDLCIVPLTIFPFVENSFKHGASEQLTDAWINIDFSVYQGDFVFKIANSKNPLMVHAHPNGIGLANVKRRLELVYGGDHSLVISNERDSFLAVLKIALTRMDRIKDMQYEDEMSHR